jgi:fibro-slime domain-containing protein
MLAHRFLTFGGFGLLAVAGVVMITTSLSADTVSMTGTIRDFNDTHPDFEDGLGTDPGIVSSTLGVDKKPVYTGLAGNPTTHGLTAFDQWYRDTAGVNLSKSHTIVLDNTITPDPNVFTYSNSSFFPIDGELLGNQGQSHNYHFTYEIHSEFTYQGGEAFSFTGDDDLWVFLNDKLAIDLGGVHGALSSSVDLDTQAAALGLAVGGTYDFDLFFAERHMTQSNFRIDTSIALQQPAIPLPAAAWMGMSLLGGLGAIRRVRRRRIV